MLNNYTIHCVTGWQAETIQRMTV